MAESHTSKLLPTFDSRRLAIETWILAVSSHPPDLANIMWHAHETVISSDEDEPVRQNQRPVIAVAPTKGSHKHLCADSHSDIPEHLRVVISRRDTPFDKPSSPEGATPAPSERGTSSGMSDAGMPARSVVPPAKRREQTKLKRIMASNKDPVKELRAQIKRIEQSKSIVYEAFETPILEKHDDEPSTHYLFKCKRPGCGKYAKQAIGTMETTALSSHLAVCLQNASQNGGKLHLFGFTGSGRMTAAEVRELWALWIAEHARPYRVVKDNHLPHLLHPDAVKYKPSPKTLSLDIKRLYTATQEHITTLLAEAPGVFHIGLDLFQSDSGFDFLGIVLFRQFVQENEPISIKRFLLECLNYDQSHTGTELGKATYGVLKKFGIQDRVWGVVCNNASNNGKMMDHVKKKKMKRPTGPLARIHCMLHILNLVAKAVLKPFHQKRQRLAVRGEANSDDEGSEVQFSVPPVDDAESDDGNGNEDIDENDDGMAPSQMLDEDEGETSDEGDDGDDGEEPDFAPPEMAPGSAEEAAFKRGTKVLFKIAQFARKLCYAPQARAAFTPICNKLGLPTPHRVPRDMKIRWNSTNQMLEGALRLFDAILEFQETTNFIPRKLHLREDDRKIVEWLLMVLKPLRTVSDILSRAGVPVLADVILHYDALNHEYERLRADSSLPIFVRQASHRAWVVLNKYYQKTDESELYRLGVLLHLSMRVHYLKAAGWEPEWIENAVDIAVACWKKHYQPQSDGSGDNASPPVSQFGYSNFLDQMFSTESESRRSGCSSMHEFVHAQIVVDRSGGRPLPVNPLAWWYAQKMARNNWDGLTPMALDVLSAPATSVDIERAFSFTGSVVSKRRHSLAPYSIQATASLGSYSKAGLVKRGSLVLLSKGKSNTGGSGKASSGKTSAEATRAKGKNKK